MPRWAKILLGIVIAVLVVLLLTVLGVKWYEGNRYSSSAGLSNESYDMAGSATGEMGLSVPGGMERSASKMAASGAGPQTATAPASSLPAERLIVKTGQISVVVKDVPGTMKNITSYVEKNGGFVVSSQVSKSGLAPYGEITVRIPSKGFENSILEVKSLGDVQRENVTGEDVTEEYVDLDSRLRNLQATEKQFLAILEKAQKIDDILAVQSELSQVRGEIEVLQGRMKYLKTSAEMSSLTIYLSTDPDVLPTIKDSNEWKPLAILKSAVRGLISVGKALANLVIYIVVFIPLWILIVLVIWAIRALIRRAKNRSEGMNFKR
jgi:hypothetical protein